MITKKKQSIPLLHGSERTLDPRFGVSSLYRTAAIGHVSRSDVESTDGRGSPILVGKGDAGAVDLVALDNEASQTDGLAGVIGEERQLADGDAGGANRELGNGDVLNGEAFKVGQRADAEQSTADSLGADIRDDYIANAVGEHCRISRGFCYLVYLVGPDDAWMTAIG